MGLRLPAGTHGTRSTALWQVDALSRDASPNVRRLRARVAADVCIVGGGFTGLWTALALKERDPEVSVAVIESGECGLGASGLAGGFAMTWWPKFGTLVKLFGVGPAVELARLSEEAVGQLGKFCAGSAADAEFRPEGWLWAATNHAQLGAWDATVALLERHGQQPYQRIPAAEAATLTGSSRHLGGVFEPGVATVDPAALVRGLRQAALDAGVAVYEQSPVRSLDRETGSLVARCHGGAVVADRVVLATNTALVASKQIRRSLVILGSDVVATAPVPEQLGETAFASGLAVSDSRRLVHYYRTTRSGRVVFGKGGGRIGYGARLGTGFHGGSRRAEELLAQLHRTFPTLSDVPITHTWCGSVDYSIDGLPFFGELEDEPGVFFGAGFSGNGVGPSWIGGQVLASLALGRDDRWATLELVRSPKGYLPPEPVRYLGGRGVRAGIVRQESRQDDGQKVGRLTRAIAAIDPTSFVG